MRSKRIIGGLWLFVAALFVAGILYSKRKETKQVPPGSYEPPVISVRVAQATVQSLPITVKSLGTLEAENSIVVTPQLAGQIKKITFDDGAAVTQGDVLFEIDGALHQGNVDAAKAGLFLAKIEHDRAKKLVDSKAMTQQFLDKASAENRQKLGLLHAAQANLDHAIIKAPFSGNMGNRQVSMGEYVGIGQPLVQLINLDNLKITYALSQGYLANVHKGQDITFETSAYPDRIFHGTVNFVGPQIDLRDRVINLQAEFNNIEHLLIPGLSIKVTQYLGEVDHAITVPTESLLASIEGNKIYKVENDKAVEVPVKIGLRSNQFVEVLSGITVNDQIIIEGQHKLKDGMAVTIIH